MNLRDDAQIPDDWEGSYEEFCVRWPNSTKWKAILRGALSIPTYLDFWDDDSGDEISAAEAILNTFNTNMHLEACSMIPSGFFGFFGGYTPPAGWLVRDGAAVSRSLYSALFAAIGTQYGQGDGTTTFNLPNALGRVDVGMDVTQPDFEDLGIIGGITDVTLSTNQMPVHTHSQVTHSHTQNAHNHTQQSHNHLQNNHSHTIFGSLLSAAGTARRTLQATSQESDVSSQVTTPTNVAQTALNNSETATNQNTQATNNNSGGGLSHSNLQPYQVGLPIIKI